MSSYCLWPSKRNNKRPPSPPPLTHNSQSNPHRSSRSMFFFFNRQPQQNSSAVISQQPPLVPQLSSTHLNILTYNFFLRPPFISDYKGDYKEERLVEFIDKVIPKYDIIAFQETFTGYSTRVNRLIKDANAKGMHAHCLGPSPNVMKGQLLDSGLLVLSRWPIVKSDKLCYSNGCTVDQLASKGASYSHHTHPTRADVHLHLFNTHLQASYNTAPPLDDETVICRHHQLSELVEFITSTTSSFVSDEHCDGYNVVLVCGDLNVNSLQDQGLEYTQTMDLLKCNDRFSVTDLLAKDLHQDYTQLPWVYFSKYYVQNNRQPPAKDVYSEFGGRLDYIFLLEPNAVSHLTKTVIDPCQVDNPLFCQLSDHMGVACELTLPQ